MDATPCGPRHNSFGFNDLNRIDVGMPAGILTADRDYDGIGLVDFEPAER
jgi:hypothetical protein